MAEPKTECDTFDAGGFARGEQSGAGGVVVSASDLCPAVGDESDGQQLDEYGRGADPGFGTSGGEDGNWCWGKVFSIDATVKEVSDRYFG